METRDRIVERALGYPYEIPPRSYVLVDGEAIDPAQVEVDRSGRIPLLAYGSNAAPEVLARKLAGDPNPVPVLRAALSGFDVVYSAHVSPYGAVPATLQRSPGTEASVFVAHLTPVQLDLISATEPNYELTLLEGTPCSCEVAGSPPQLSAYLSRHGCLLVDGSEVAVAEVEATARRFPAMSQRQVLERVRDVLRPGRDLERFIVDCASGSVPNHPPLQSRQWPSPPHACDACAAPRPCAASSARRSCRRRT